jgi:lipoic acid synthetase
MKITPKAPGRLPSWLRKDVPLSPRYAEVEGLLRRLNLATVCRSAHCPNQAECFAHGTATFMILGENCTRNCRFCAVGSGQPTPPRADEPAAVAEAAATLGLQHVVVTSVTRDDLIDGGAAHFAATIAAIHAAAPKASIEVLTPDFAGVDGAIEVILDAAGPASASVGFVFNHNLETVRRLAPLVRPQADYDRSLALLAAVRSAAEARNMRVLTKSGLMVGLGESDDEIPHALADLRAVGCDILTIGQYLSPSAAHAPVARYVEPERFDGWAKQAREMGFAAVAAGPLVRSSYRAGEVMSGQR